LKVVIHRVRAEELNSVKISTVVKKGYRYIKVMV